MTTFACKEIKVKPHHVKGQISSTRAKYRDGRKATAVKVYTINQESNYLLIQGVPAVGARDDLQSLCEQYGNVKLHPLDEYPCEEFTEVYLAAYEWFPAARTAKKHLDDKSFFGGNLHVCYAPEFETVEETRQKLQNRRKYVSMKIKQESGVSSDIPLSGSENVAKRCRVEPSDISFDSSKSAIPPPEHSAHQPVTYIWAGKEYTVYPACVDNSAESVLPNSEPEDQSKRPSSTYLLPRPLARIRNSVSQNVNNQR